MVEQNFTRPKGDFWSYLNSLYEIVVVWDDRKTQIETGQVCHQAYLSGWRLREKMNMDPCFKYIKGYK